MKIKVCGMKYADNIESLDRLHPDMTGFIFYEKSPRFTSRLPEYMPSSSLRVGVFVNHDNGYILNKVEEFGLDMVQLHGNETPGQCAFLLNKGIDIIKAFSLGCNDADIITQPYEGLCKYYLFDTPCRGHGGSGRVFDWNLTEHYHGRTPFLLSGGINPDSIDRLSSFSHPSWAGIDINSGFEISPGLKDINAISEFIRKLRTI